MFTFEGMLSLFPPSTSNVGNLPHRALVASNAKNVEGDRGGGRLREVGEEGAESGIPEGAGSGIPEGARGGIPEGTGSGIPEGAGGRRERGTLHNIAQYFAFEKINAKRRQPTNTGQEPGLKGMGSGRFNPPCSRTRMSKTFCSVLKQYCTSMYIV